MPVTDREMMMLRAHIAGEDEVARRALLEHLAGGGDLSSLAVLVYSSFVITAQRHFTPRWNSGQVVRYVARLRAILGDMTDTSQLLDPLVAEDELQLALGAEPATPHRPFAVIIARLLLLDVLVADLRLDDAGLRSLLAEARSEADRLLAIMRC